MSYIDELFQKYAKLFQIGGEMTSGTLYLNRYEFKQALTEALEKQQKDLADIAISCIWLYPSHRVDEVIKNEFKNYELGEWESE